MLKTVATTVLVSIPNGGPSNEQQKKVACDVKKVLNRLQEWRRGNGS